MDSISNAELMELFFAAQQLLDAQFQYWLSASFAAIVASFVAGERLTRNMSYILVLLYVGATALFTLRYFAAAGTLTLYGAESTARELIGEIGRDLTPVMQVIRIVLFITGTAATIWFLLTKKLRK